MIRRVQHTLTLFAVLALAGSAYAQTARATGVVKDTDGKGIKGATIRATNPDAVPPQIISTTDDKGRWAILGMRIGTYSFRVEAPGFLPVQADANVRTAVTPPLQFTLARDPGPIPGALPSNIQAQLSAANMLRDQGRLDQASSRSTPEGEPRCARQASRSARARAATTSYLAPCPFTSSFHFVVSR